METREQKLLFGTKIYGIFCFILSFLSFDRSSISPTVFSVRQMKRALLTDEQPNRLGLLLQNVPEGGHGVGVERGAGADVGHGDEHGGGALPVQQLDAAQQGRQELVHDPRLETVPEVAGKLIVYRDAVPLRRECCLLNSPEILHAIDPN